MVEKISTHAELEDIKTKNLEKLILIDFYATWCGPCKAISPFVESLTNLFKDKIIVLKVDVDDTEADALVSHFKVTSMPMFVLLKRGEHIDTLIGASEAKLKALVEKNLN